jgi:hypothetical protein
MPDDAMSAEEISAEARKTASCTVYHVDCVGEWELSQRYSSWTRLVWVTAYVLRFIENSKRRRNLQPGKKLLLDRDFRIARSHPPLVLTRTKSSLFKGMECIKQWNVRTSRFQNSVH